MSQDPLRYFRIEARELVDQISAGVLDLDQQPGPDLVARLLRFAHTLKGAARVVRQPEIADRAHAFEEVLVPHRGGGEPLPAEQMRELLRLNDEIEERVAALEPQSAPPAAPMRFPAGMTPGGPSPSTAPKPTGDRTRPGTPPERRGTPGVTRSTAGTAGTAGAVGSGGSGSTAGSAGAESGQPHRAADGPGAEASADAHGKTDASGGTFAGGGIGRRGVAAGNPDPGGGGEAAAGGQHQRQSTSGRDARSENASADGEPSGHGASAGRGPSSRRAVGGRAGEQSGQRSGARDAPEAGGGQAARRRSTSDDSAQTSGGRGTTTDDLHADVETASDGFAGTGSGQATDTAAAPHGGPDTHITTTPTNDSDTSITATAHNDSDAPLASDGTAGSGTAAVSDDRTDIRSAPGSDPAQPVGSSHGPSPQSDSRRGSSSQESSTPQESVGHPHPAVTGTASRTTAVAPAGKGEDAPRSPSHPESAPAARGATADVDELLDAVGEAHARFAPLRTGGQSLDRLTRSAEALADQLRVGRTAAHTDAARVVAARLASDLGALGRQITDTVEQVERELDEVRGRAERLRLVSASSIFTALHRAVRDAADAQGKRVRFEGRGGDLRLDPQVLTLANNALLHVVRNAVAHGIEPDEDRLAAGKPVEGNVVVAVERRGRYVAFRCTDDGRGFDLVAVRRTAEERGLLMPGGTPPDEQTLVELVLRGGISTSPTVTEVAGRGIGLDVARDVADQLGGEVSVRTEAGLGAVVELVLPLALMSLHGLIVEAAGTVATVPLDAVRTCVRLLPEQAAAAAVTGKMAHDGEAIPFLPLARALYAGTTVPEGGGPTVAVIVGLDGDSVAVGVDRLAGTSTLVVRPLPDLAPAAPVIGGVSMDLDGNPRLVLDAQGLVAETLRLGGGGAAPAEPVRRLPILVVDDSLTTRMLERSILESAGYEVDLAASGEEGLERARSRRYGLYLTDIDMPGIDGFTFVSETRADPELAGVPAILVSSRASAEDRQRGAAVGASAYVVKGEFNQEELLAHIRRLVPA